MEDEDQLQSLAKRLINIYNACKWSKTKLHIRKKRRTFRNTDDHPQTESFTEIESESSARTVFVYDRKIRRRTEAEENRNLEPTALREYLEGLEQNILFSENIEPFRNNQAVNVCACKKYSCDAGPGKPGPAYEFVDRRRTSETKKKNSKLIICLTPTKRKNNASNPPRGTNKGCCCYTPNNVEPRGYETPPPEKKKSNLKSYRPQSISSSPNRDCMCQCGPNESDHFSPVINSTSPCPDELFCPYYPPPPPPPKIKVSKAERCECCPPWAPTKKCGCPPNDSGCCQYSPPKPFNHTCCQCSPTPRKTSGCCQCSPTPPISYECCQCPPLNTPDCCHCEPDHAASFGCQCCPPPSFSPPSACCCDYDEYIAYDHICNCPVEEDIEVIRTDRIIIPTMYFNEDEPTTPSANLSYAVSEEVKSELLNDNSLDGRPYNKSDKSVDKNSKNVIKPHKSVVKAEKGTNTSCVVVRSCSDTKIEPEPVVVPAPVPIPPKLPSKAASIIPQTPTNRPCYCKPDMNDSSSFVVQHSYTSTHKNRNCHGVCCGCPQPPHGVPVQPDNHHEVDRQGAKIQNPNNPIAQVPIVAPVPNPPARADQNVLRPENNMIPPIAQANQPILRPEHKMIPPIAHAPAYNGNLNPHTDEERMIAKYSPHPFGEQTNPMYSPPPNNQSYLPYASNYNGTFGIPGIVPPPRFVDHSALLRSQSTPLCCKLFPKGGGDDKIAGINIDTEAEIYATLQKIEMAMRDEADMHSRNVRCIVDQVCRQGGDIKELKILVAGVVEDKKSPTCKQVEKKIRKLEKRKEKQSKKNRQTDIHDRIQIRKLEEKESEVSNPCCKCGKQKAKKAMGCWGTCCAKRCRGCCGRCCGGCCPKCCNTCCFPFEKCCHCCCAIARCCDSCWSCNFLKRRRKKKCKCTK